MKKRFSRTLLFTGLSWLSATGCFAAEYVVANLGSRSFDVLLRTDTAPSSAMLEIFSDAEGTVPATGLTVEQQPIFGSTQGTEYERRTADRQLRNAISAAGNSLFRVENADADTPYYLRIVFDEEQLPSEGLTAVRTLPAGDWRNNAEQLITDIERAGSGWIGTLSISNAAAPLLAVCGDGVPTDDELYFNLADFRTADGAAIELAAGEPMTLTLYGKAGTPPTEKIIPFAPPAQSADVAALSTELTPLLQLIVASAIQGLSSPPEGESFLFDGNQITCRLNQTEITSNGMQRLCYGFSGSGSVPLNGRSTEFSFTLNTDSELNWNWRTNLWLEVVADHGSIDLPSGWYRTGSQLSASVTSDAEWEFAGWSGAATGSNLLTGFTLNSPSTLQALFNPLLVPGGDGMPEWWLTAAGLAGADRDPDSDLDRDGFSTKHEWVTDTDPSDPDSQFRIKSLTRNPADGQMRLIWQGGREARQIIEATDNMASTNWVAVYTNLPPTETIGECSVLIEGQQNMYFRIRAER